MSTQRPYSEKLLITHKTDKNTVMIMNMRLGYG